METTTIQVPKDKAEFLKKLSLLSIESLKILAEKSQKPGIEIKLKAMKNFI